MMDYKVFISYSRENSKFVSELATSLKEYGVPVWLDVWDIDAGEKWHHEIQAALESCTHFMIVLSNASVVSNEVDNELQYAISKNKVIVPVMFEECEIPFRIYSIQYVDFTSGDFEEGVARLLRKFRETISSVTVTGQFKPPIRAKKFDFKWIIGLVATVAAAVVLWIFWPQIGYQAGEATETDQVQAVATATVQTEEKPEIAPLEDGQYMVLLCDLENVGREEQDITGVIYDDLVQQLEINPPLTNIAVRRYPVVVTSREEAGRIAQEVGASLVLWGYYESDEVVVNIQYGMFEDSVSIQSFSREMVERMVNVQVRLENARQQSMAKYTAIGMGLLHMFDFGYDAALAQIIQESISEAEGDLSGNNLSEKLYSGFMIAENPEKSVSFLDAAIEIDSANPVLYLMRGNVYFRLGRYQEASQELQAAARLGPDEPWLGLMMWSMYVEQLQMNLEDAIILAENIAALKPGDWYSVHYLGVLYYEARVYETAMGYFDEAMEIGPEFNFPYIYGGLTAMHLGQIEVGLDNMQKSLAIIPDPELVNRMANTGIGENFYLGPLAASYTRMVLGQYVQAVEDADEALGINPALVDAYFLKGFAHCNLGEYAAAEEAYSAAIELEPNFALLYLLRAEVNSYAGDTAGAEEDLVMVTSSEQAAVLQSYIEAAQTGEFDCTTIFNLEE